VDTVLAGSVFSLSVLTSLGVLMLAFKMRRYGGFWTGAFLLLFISEFAVNIIKFSKADALLTLICAVLGVYLAKPTTRVLWISAPIAVLFYVLLAPIVTAGRDRIARQSREGLIYQATLTERFQIGKDLLTSLDGLYDSDEQGWWTRLCYSVPQAFMMQMYDTGRSGDSYSLALYTFIPRVIWKDKPIITQPGEDVTELMFGHSGSSTGITIFAEAYWNGGWVLVFGTCIYLGVLFAALEHSAAMAMFRSEWLLLPCALMSTKTGLRVDGWFAADFVGGVVIYAVYYIAARRITEWLGTGRKTSVHPYDDHPTIWRSASP
jgi:hypothetical protein